MDGDGGAGLPEGLGEGEGRGLAYIVGAGLERGAPHGDPGALDGALAQGAGDEAEGDVAARGLAHVGDGVDVADLQAEEGVRGALGQFGGVRVGDEDRHARLDDPGVHGADRLLALRGGDTGDEAVRAQGVLDGVTFAQELRVPYDVDLFAGGGQALGEGGDLVGGADGDGGLPDDRARPVEVGGRADGPRRRPVRCRRSGRRRRWGYRRR